MLCYVYHSRRRFLWCFCLLWRETRDEIINEPFYFLFFCFVCSLFWDVFFLSFLIIRSLRRWIWLEGVLNACQKRCRGGRGGGCNRFRSFDREVFVFRRRRVCIDSCSGERRRRGRGGGRGAEGDKLASWAAVLECTCLDMKPVKHVISVPGWNTQGRRSPSPYATQEGRWQKRRKRRSCCCFFFFFIIKKI